TDRLMLVDLRHPGPPSKLLANVALTSDRSFEKSACMRSSCPGPVEGLDVAGVLRQDRATTRLHRRRELVSAWQPGDRNDRERLDPFRRRQMLVRRPDLVFDRFTHHRLASEVRRR